MMQQSRYVGVDSGKLVPLQARGSERLVAVASEYRLPGVDWDYYNTVTQLLEYTFNWPEGFVAHLAWRGDGEWRTLNLWRSEDLRQRFFSEVAVHRISQGIQLLGAVTGRGGATDVEPVEFAVTKFILGPRASAFAGIGEDRDGSAVRVLGGEPIVVELDVTGMRPEDYELLIASLGYDTALPAELISHHAMVEEDGMRIVETWSGSGHALVALGAALLPTIERLGAERRRDFLSIHQEHVMKRIALNPEVVAAFTF